MGVDSTNEGKDDNGSSLFENGDNAFLDRKRKKNMTASYS